MNTEKIVEMINNATKCGSSSEPCVFLFDDDSKDTYEQTVETLKGQDYKFININEFVQTPQEKKLNDLIDDKTILIVTYNDLYLQNKVLYETVRSMLKDGYRANGKGIDIALTALVYCETKENLRDFCYYGLKVNNN